MAKAGTTEPAMFAGQLLSLQVGDAEAALAAAPYQVDVTYRATTRTRWSRTRRRSPGSLTS
ncbi:MAG: hypothetical protein ABSB76_09860 [Streptosporangiaceae bacterium]